MKPEVARLIAVVLLISSVVMLVVGVREPGLSFLKYMAVPEALAALVFYWISVRKLS